MLDSTIHKRAQEWLSSPDCHLRSTVDYIRKADKLRPPQIEAIETYLYLKIAGENRPLGDLLANGFFSEGLDVSRLEMADDAKEIFRESVAARSVLELARRVAKNSSSVLSPQERLLAAKASEIDFKAAARAIFYGVEYNDYLFSLPMGAGKTYLMAAIMYLDLYFADLEPTNKLFAHNFLVLVPSGLKSSIIPSLKTIERFEPSWVIPEPAASSLKKLIKFEVLDEAKSAKKSNKAKNPNVQKIARHQPFEDLMGLIAVVNAEKVILDRVELDSTGHLFEKTEDEKDQLANELRAFIGKIPNLQIHIDEVHHATKDEVKLRQVVNRWNSNGNVNGVLGYSGTPYVEGRAEKLPLTDSITLNSERITNTVYYYPLIEGVRTFLKAPQIKSEQRGLTSLQIIEKGVKDFQHEYGTRVYPDGTIAKLAIYCGTIDRLESEVFPLLTGKLRIDPAEILKYHIGNKQHPAPVDAELNFKVLDDPSSQKRYILLVQIGKEGWDCRSLTSVILSQSGDCPKNMVLQTSCRCLRQVTKGEHETALIWLSKDNADVLENQLQEKERTSIAALNKAGDSKEDVLERFERTTHLKLPPIDFWQMKVEYETNAVETDADPQTTLNGFDAEAFHQQAIISTRKLADGDDAKTSVIADFAGVNADFDQWLFSTFKEGFRSVSLEQLNAFRSELLQIFETITIAANGTRRFNDLYDLSAINSKVRLAFHSHSELVTREELIPDDAKMLIVEKLKAIARPRNFLPPESDVEQILASDKKGSNVEELDDKVREIFERQRQELEALGMSFQPAAPNGLSKYVKAKDRTFHYLPYKFDSGFEKLFLDSALSLDTVKEKGLEIYFNGEKDLTDFRIVCYTKNRNYVGRYTPDFLVIQRKEKKIHRVLILETKGSGYAEQTAFKLRRRFVESDFLRLNNEKFKYDRFDYLYLTDADSDADNLIKFKTKLNHFFAD